MPYPSSNREAALKLTTRRVREEFETILCDRHYIGVRNFLSGLLMEPRNPFQKADRRPKKWVVAVATVGALAFVLIHEFHLR